VYLTYFYRLGYLYAKNYQIWFRFDDILTKTSWVIFWHTLYIKVDFLSSDQVAWQIWQRADCVNMGGCSSSQEPISQLRSVTCHIKSQSVTCHWTQVNAFRLNHSQADPHLVLDLSTPER